jgi:hypothetical protein
MLSLHSISLVFIIETKCIYCTVRNESLNVISVKFFCHSPSISSLISYRRDPGLLPKKTLCELCGGQNGRWTDFLPSSSGFPLATNPQSGFGGLEVPCWPLGFCVFKPGRSRRIFQGEKNPQHAFLRRGSKSLSHVADLRHVKEP